MTTKTEIEQLRAEFEEWCETRTLETGRDHEGDYISLETALSWEAYQAGRAALQSQKPKGNDIMLSGVIRMPFEMAMADPISRMQFYQRAQQALNELEALQSQPKTEPSEWLKQHEALMHRVSKAAIVVGYGGTINGVTAEQALENAEKALLDHARSLQSQDREDAELSKIGHAIYRACYDLPDGYEIRIDLEKGSGIVYVTDRDGDEVMIDSGGELFSYQINEAIDHARRVEGENDA